jgi:hypothetical protein
MMTQTKEPVGGSTMELVNADRHGCVCVPTYSIATDAFHKAAVIDTCSPNFLMKCLSYKTKKDEGINIFRLRLKAVSCRFLFTH